jgi:hypothetical protein
VWKIDAIVKGNHSHVIEFNKNNKKLVFQYRHQKVVVFKLIKMLQEIFQIKNFMDGIKKENLKSLLLFVLLLIASLKHF